MVPIKNIFIKKTYVTLHSKLFIVIFFKLKLNLITFSLSLDLYHFLNLSEILYLEKKKFKIKIAKLKKQQLGHKIMLNFFLKKTIPSDMLSYCSSLKINM